MVICIRLHVNDISDLLKIWSFEMKTGLKCLNSLFFSMKHSMEMRLYVFQPKTDVFDMSEYVSIYSPVLVICNYI